MSRVRILIAMVVMSGILGPAVPEADSASVPFKGNIAGAITGQDVQSPTEVVLTTVGSGNATHLGKFTSEEELHFNPQTGSFTGTITFTAANGDKVVCTLTGQFASETAAAGEYVITAGGTGRFADASGGASFNVLRTGPTTFQVNFSGDISF